MGLCSLFKVGSFYLIAYWSYYSLNIGKNFNLNNKFREGFCHCYHVEKFKVGDIVDMFLIDEGKKIYFSKNLILQICAFLLLKGTVNVILCDPPHAKKTLPGSQFYVTLHMQR